MIIETPSNSALRKRKRGFTLTEIAIVLGIIGLILGAIWVAAAAVYNNLRISKATTQLLVITQNMRSMYATSSAVDTGSDMTTVGTTCVALGAATTYAQAGIFPADTVVGLPAGPVCVNGPWTNSSINVVAAKVSAAADSFAVEFNNVPQSACISMLTQNTGTGRDPGLFAVGASVAGTLNIAAGGAGTGAVTTFPVAASVAQTKCSNALSNVAFQFTIKG
jgi:prepilin-type N-terminal cleavage/methylation domain-containing protein